MNCELLQGIDFRALGTPVDIDLGCLCKSLNVHFGGNIQFWHTSPIDMYTL